MRWSRRRKIRVGQKQASTREAAFKNAADTELDATLCWNPKADICPTDSLAINSKLAQVHRYRRFGLTEPNQNYYRVANALHPYTHLTSLYPELKREVRRCCSS
ncbi:hypothetical protein PGT21_035565 [Puccinia graminis f. sp. tritici]|uniref:Uncharacterized protein n=1 Tax=Puccinia graminis f. sp. tritici TaxID=56615 RepID=A0A5B0PCT1_PUCGR|nr:hypothetical protein PGT21_035485 [Puccinia graminis f. sp. tritici]KAA1100299.1 hypothetical protein PGTUg99_011034 [Puccinia graminis f. sp. tritici]KAA1102058.1 hypothetical protein PGT21_035565 [Puccinia graminis f. sp. tritici]KAA1103593.1 hypothetical protein PGTUg99_001439 [Puccinia graminis f. sp. tritici]